MNLIDTPVQQRHRCHPQHRRPCHPSSAGCLSSAQSGMTPTLLHSSLKRPEWTFGCVSGCVVLELFISWWVKHCLALFSCLPIIFQSIINQILFITRFLLPRVGLFWKIYLEVGFSIQSDRVDPHKPCPAFFYHSIWDHSKSFWAYQASCKYLNPTFAPEKSNPRYALHVRTTSSCLYEEPQHPECHPANHGKVISSKSVQCGNCYGPCFSSM